MKLYYFVLLIFLVTISCSKSSKTQQINQITESQIDSEPQVQYKNDQDSILRAEKEKIRKYGTEEEYQDFLNTQQDFLLRYEDRFKSMMIDGELPVSFPRHNEGESEDSYMGNVKTWLDSNPQFVKPQHRK